ncbi:DUF1090 domain-containing protein [Pusillimonas sp. ANT_WB101]|uniref:DUF1090 domain-containing protein n=1 Tax=Pusillimonas sp. ANT_WB101 TaxID=2597356 RepID=UPI0011EF903A|nr:DUF1090 domain-containing protein [Pusillimonas sp. ANT_WB101]KAA0889949.1 DUF1090 domain-containing protein [Pusillimonas sp. ANT_WB101]
MNTIKLAIPILLFGLVGPALAASPACERKEVEIKNQIQHAKENNNMHRVRGLEKALSQVQAHCTDAALIKDKKEDIAEQQEDIDELLEEIQQKQSEGQYDKVQKLERKLGREREELQSLQHELKELEA